MRSMLANHTHACLLFKKKIIVLHEKCVGVINKNALHAVKNVMLYFIKHDEPLLSDNGALRLLVLTD